ncbi:hypothetical protein [Nitrosomonas supralitoralis]|uniref:hypothetical protein n=1 Tax=Nitrosomonas supralitoralis TaxID=2116706 RepID=UPI0018D4DBCC|nr:hypothetical protein [Nitrosomonas supralitoralis]
MREASDFYKLERDWSSRLIVGDSLPVMNLLLQKEDMVEQERLSMGEISRDYTIQ